LLTAGLDHGQDRFHEAAAASALGALELVTGKAARDAVPGIADR
jgi:hypothetical protein